MGDTVMNPIGGPEVFRGFIAITPPPFVKEALARMQQELKAHWAGDWIRWPGPEQMHLTLKFLGNVRSGDAGRIRAAMDQTAEGLGRFRVSVQSLGCFPTVNRPQVIWAGVGGDTEALLRVQAGIDERTRSHGGHDDDRGYHPHLTLARISRFKRELRIMPDLIERNKERSFGEWEAAEIELFESRLSAEGSVYRLLHTSPLRG